MQPTPVYKYNYWKNSDTKYIKIYQLNYTQPREQNKKKYMEQKSGNEYLLRCKVIAIITLQDFLKAKYSMREVIHKGYGSLPYAQAAICRLVIEFSEHPFFYRYYIQQID